MTPRVPPHSDDAEASVLGAMLMHPNAPEIVDGILTASDLYSDRHRWIFEAAMSLHREATTPDIVSVVNRLTAMKRINDVGGAFYITELLMRVPTVANVATHARIVREKAIKRQVIQASHAALEACYDDATDALEQADRFAETAVAIAERRGPSGIVRPFATCIDEALEHTAKARAAREEGRLLGVATGLDKIDNMLGGLQPTNHTVLAARTAMGKTALAVRMIRGAAANGAAALLFSLEMSAKQIAVRALAAEAGCSAHGLFTGRRDDIDTLAASTAAEVLRGLPIYIVDTSGLTLRDIRSITRQEKRRHNIELVALDYLGLLTPDAKADTREREVAEFSKGMKQLAKDENIPALSLVQLNRVAADGRRPSLANLAEADAIARDADAVLLLHRPEYYGVKEMDDGRNSKGIAEVIIDKQRNGPTGVVEIAFIAERVTFENLDIRDDAPAYLNNTNHATPAHAPARRPYQDDPYRDDDDDPF